MNYRVVVIYEIKANQLEKVRIEVCLATKSRNLSPFQRRITLQDLWDIDNISNKKILQLLDQTGQENQPFSFEGRILSVPNVRQAFQSCGSSYIQICGKGSLKKYTNKFLFPFPCKGDLIKGSVRHGELYINDVQNWKNNIQIRILYADALTSFHFPFNDMPFLTRNGDLRLRDEEQERTLINQVGEFLNDETSTISLPDYDISHLTELTKNGWHLLVQDQQGSKHRLYAKRDSSGVEWFSTSEEFEETPSQKILEAYLRHRHYIEADAQTILFDHKKATEQNPEQIVECLGKQDMVEVSNAYKNHIHLTESQKHSIEADLKEKCKARLYPYQLQGVFWLYENRLSKTGCLLADEMGLGKTLQVLAHLSIIKGTSNIHLIIVPTSLIPNWQNEIKSFFPQWESDVEIQPHSPTVTKKIIISSYDIIRLNIDEYRGMPFDTIVIDEAQAIKNDNTQKYRAIASLHSEHVIIMTGTPIENSVREIWSLFYILNPSFRLVADSMKKYATSQDDSNYIELSSKVLKPFILRRTKEEVSLKLPKKEITDILVDMTTQERDIYNRIRQMVVTAVRTGVSGRLNSIVLEGLLRMRQACVDCSLLPTSLNTSAPFVSTKLKQALAYTMLFKNEGHKVLIFSQFVGVLHRMELLCADKKIVFENLYGDTADRRTPVEKFQNDDNVSVFLISLKAGGVGLNLTAADRIILLDDWWNPAVEDQAFARAHRIGQNNDVEIYRIICRDTVEEKLLKLQEKKRQTIDIFNSTSSKLTYEELKELIF